jgi:hypothetical protein
MYFTHPSAPAGQAQQQAALDQAAALCGRWPELASSEMKAIIRQLVHRIEVSRDLLRIEVSPPGLLKTLRSGLSDAAQ